MHSINHRRRRCTEWLAKRRSRNSHPESNAGMPSICISIAVWIGCDCISFPISWPVIVFFFLFLHFPQMDSIFPPYTKQRSARTLLLVQQAAHIWWIYATHDFNKQNKYRNKGDAIEIAGRPPARLSIRPTDFFPSFSLKHVHTAPKLYAFGAIVRYAHLNLNRNFIVEFTSTANNYSPFFSRFVRCNIVHATHDNHMENCNRIIINSLA